jgi:transcriptional regulator with PAS, ATPase and Fis domain
MSWKSVNKSILMSNMLPNSNPDNPLISVLRMAGALLAISDVNELLRKGLALCLDVLKCERCFLLSRTDRNYTEILEYLGSGDKTIPYSSTALHHVMKSGGPILISDTIGDDAFRDQDSIQRSDIRSIMCSRLALPQTSFTDKNIFLYLDSSIAQHSFSGEDLEVFRLLSELIASMVNKTEMLAEKETTIETLKSQVKEKQFENLVFQSPSFEKCIVTIKQAAPTDAAILLIGESGTGKEMLAKAIHKLSRRSEGNFIPVNCGAIPENLLESEFFGHEKGAFTGAIAPRTGFFEAASNGTLFLDEISELPMQLQVKLLRALQEKEIHKIGSVKYVKVNVRIIAAANTDLEQAVNQNKFRKDLFFRLNVIQVRIPPVRERGQDALLLSRYFLKQYCEVFGAKNMEFSKAAEKAILMFSWPGNVREIQNRIQNAVITSRGSMITPESLNLTAEQETEYTSIYEAREAVDKKMIANALEKSPGNLTNAAKILDMDRKSLRQLIKKYGFDADTLNGA